MKESWWSKNSKWVSPTIAILTFVGGIFIGYFRAIDKYESKLEVMQLKLENRIDDSVNDAKKDIENLIQQRVLTDFATKLKWEIKKELTEGE